LRQGDIYRRGKDLFGKAAVKRGERKQRGGGFKWGDQNSRIGWSDQKNRNKGTGRVRERKKNGVPGKEKRLLSFCQGIRKFSSRGEWYWGSAQISLKENT